MNQHVCVELMWCTIQNTRLSYTRWESTVRPMPTVLRHFNTETEMSFWRNFRHGAGTSENFRSSSSPWHNAVHPWYIAQSLMFNTLGPRQDGRHLANIFKRIFLNDFFQKSIAISLKFIPKGPIENIPALVQITAWRRPGDKPLSEPMMVWFT